MKKILSALVVTAFLFTSCATNQAATGSRPCEQIASAKQSNKTVLNAVVVGDRVLDVMMALGYDAKGAAVRFSQWPGASQSSAKRLGCPRRVTVVDKTALATAIAELGVDTLYVEDNSKFCLLMPKVNPVDAVDIIKASDVASKVKIVTIDCNGNVESIIMNVARALNKEKEGKALYADYKKRLAAAEALLPKAKKPGLKVVVLTANLKQDTGRLFVSAESKGYHADIEFLQKFGCVNISDGLNINNEQVAKGTFLVPDLKKLADLNPDVIVAFGATKELKEKLEPLNLKALKNGAYFDSLPYYVGSDLIEYPEVLTAWINAFSSL